MFLDKEINTEILDLIRLPHGNFSFSFDENKDFESKLIIPEDEKHEYLIHNFKISESIFDFYYIQTNRYLTDIEYQELQESGYFGYKKEYTLKPYPFEICGAPFHRIDLLEKVKLLSWKEPKKRPKITNKNIVKISDLAPYFKEYAAGFKDGYEKFEESQIIKFLPYLADKNDYIQKVFEFLTTEIIFERSWFNNHRGFKISQNSISDVGKIINAFEDGIKQGYFYKAWTIVFSNNNLFTPLFEDYFKTKKFNSDSKKIDYLNEEIDNLNLIEEFENSINKIVEKSENGTNDLGCYPQRFSIIPKAILNENVYRIERKKYLLKQMYLILEEKKSNLIVAELLNEFLFILEPYDEVYKFIAEKSEVNITEENLKREIRSNAQKVSYTYRRCVENNERFYFTTVENFIEHYHSGINNGKTKEQLVKFYSEYFINPIKEKNKAWYDFYSGNYYAPYEINEISCEVPIIQFQTKDEFRRKLEEKLLVEEIVKFEKFLNELENTKTFTVKESKRKDLKEYLINKENADDFLSGLKEKFPQIKGKNLAGLIYLLKKNNVIVIEDRGLKSFVEAWSRYFDYNINYEAIRKNKDADFDDIFLKPIRSKLEISDKR